jgi:hypothetical protein
VSDRWRDFLPVGYHSPFEHGATVLEGPDSMPAAEAVRDLASQKREWPYPWLFPPPGAVRVSAGLDSSGTLLVPVAGVATQGLLYTVDEGFQFALEKLVVIFIGGTVLPGDFTWSLTRNQPVGVSSFQGVTVQGFQNVDVPLGSLQIPWPLECPELFDPNDAIRVALTNVNLTSGAGNFFKSILLGWRWPVG